MLFHKFRHIQPDQRVRGVEQIHGQLFHQLRLAHAGGADENKADGLVLGRDTHPVPPHGGRHRRDGFVLSDDVALEALLQLAEPLEFLLPDLGGLDFGPQLDDVGDVLHGQLGISLQKQGVQLRLTLEDLAFQRGDLLVIRLRALLRPLLLQHGPFFFKVIDLPLKLHPPGDVRVLQVQIGAGLIDQVDGLIRQKAVGDIPLAQ